MQFEVTILGSNSALPTSNRYPTAQVLNVLGRFFLIDCGEGTQMQLRKNKISLAAIDHIFISHTHGDHIFGLIGLISTMVLLGRKKDLHIYAHSELQRYTQFQMDFLFQQETAFRLVFHPLSFKTPKTIYSDKKVEVISFPLKHRIATCGFLFKEIPALPNLKKEKIEQYQIPIRDRQGIKEGGNFILPNGQVILHSELTNPAPKARSYAFCSDTAYYPNIVETIQGVSLLYHEATFTEEHASLAEETYHSTSRQAAEIARQANAKRLLIGHFSSRYKSIQPLLQEAKNIFPATVAVCDNEVYKVEE